MEPKIFARGNSASKSPAVSNANGLRLIVDACLWIATEEDSSVQWAWPSVSWELGLQYWYCSAQARIWK